MTPSQAFEFHTKLDGVINNKITENYDLVSDINDLIEGDFKLLPLPIIEVTYFDCKPKLVYKKESLKNHFCFTKQIIESATSIEIKPIEI